MTKLIHIGDLHFWSFVVNPFNLLNKRALGYGNLVVKRSREFKQVFAPILQNYIIQQKPDYCLFSGDFTTTSLTSEFMMAKEFIELIKQKTGAKVFLVPGNHDRYTVRNHKSKTLEKNLTQISENKDFPFVHQLEDNLVIGIDATTKNGFGSFGLMKNEDISKVEKWLEEYLPSISRVLILCHFPYEAPRELMRKDRGIQLYSGDSFLKVLNKFNLPMYFLHGHHHYRWVWKSPLCDHLTYINAGAPFISHKKTPPDLGFHEINILHDSVEFKRHRCIDLQKSKWETYPFETPLDAKPVSLL